MPRLSSINRFLLMLHFNGVVYKGLYPMQLLNLAQQEPELMFLEQR